MDKTSFSTDEIFNNTAKFTKLNFDSNTSEYINHRNQDISNIELDDIKKRIMSRNRYGIALVVLLYLQNLFVFGLVTYALFLNRLEGLQLIFATLVSATLSETIFTINIIVKWLFKDIVYKFDNSPT